MWPFQQCGQYHEFTCAWLLTCWETSVQESCVLEVPLDSKSFTLDSNKWSLKCAYSSAFAQVFFWTALLWWDRKTVECLTNPLRNTWEKYFLKSKKTKPLSFLEIYCSILSCRNNTQCLFHTKEKKKNSCKSQVTLWNLSIFHLLDMTVDCNKRKMSV